MTAFESTPDYPPLSSCIVVETDLFFRREITQALLATKLFASVSEPASLSDALQELDERGLDACLVGPTLINERIGGFLQEARRRDCSQSCVFFACLSNDPEESEDLDLELQQVGFDAVLRQGLSERDFYHTVINTVIEVNQAKLAAKNVLGVDLQQKRAAQSRNAQATELVQLLQTASVELKSILNRARVTPSFDYKVKVHQLVLKLAENGVILDGATLALLEEAFVEWVGIGLSDSVAAANEKLRRRLIELTSH